MPTNIKVNREALIKALEAEQKKATEEFKRGMAKFREAEKRYPEQLALALEKAAKQVHKGATPKETISTRRNGKYVEVPVFEDFPEKPSKPNDNRSAACTLQRQIRMLKMSSEPTIKLNEDSDLIKFVCEIQ